MFGRPVTRGRTQRGSSAWQALHVQAGGLFRDPSGAKASRMGAGGGVACRCPGPPQPRGVVSHLPPSVGHLLVHNQHPPTQRLGITLTYDLCSGSHEAAVKVSVRLGSFWSSGSSSERTWLCWQNSLPVVVGPRAPVPSAISWGCAQLSEATLPLTRGSLLAPGQQGRSLTPRAQFKGLTD